MSPIKKVCLLLLLSVLLIAGQTSKSIAEPPIALDLINDLSKETDEGELIPIDLEASDADDDNLTFVIKTPPQNGVLSEIVRIDKDSARVKYTPKKPFVGKDTFIFIVSDDGGQDEGKVEIDVRNVPPGPVNLPIQSSYNEGAAITFTVTATDPGGNQQLTYQWDFGDDNPVVESARNEEVHTYVNDGHYTLTLKVKDMFNGVSETQYSITVTNVAPVITNPLTVRSEDDQPIDIATQSIQEGQKVTFSITAEDPSVIDNEMLNYQWDFGDGVKRKDRNLTSVDHTYKDNEEYTLVLTVSDDERATVNRQYTIVVDNVAPEITEFPSETNLEAKEGTDAFFVATASDIGSEDVLTYQWDFGDGNTESNENLTSVSHVYKDDGEYNLGLTVIDDDGGSATQSGIVKVKNLPPVIGVINIPEEVREGELFKLSAQAEDPGEKDTLKFSWDFGDDNTAEGNVVNHSYVNNKDYALTLTVQDNEGAEAQKTIILPIKNVDPIINAFTVPRGIIYEGDVVEFSASGSDVGIEDILTYIWDFGDGNTAVGEKVNYVYTNDSPYQVNLTVRDSDDGIATRSQIINVLNVAPVIKEVNMPESAKEGEEVTFSVIATDRGTDDVLSYVWIFGDGQVGVGEEVTRAYSNNGIYQISVTVRDPEGGLATTDPSIPFSVENVAPVIEKVEMPKVVGEGEVVQFRGIAIDAGSADVLTYAWDFGDGENGEGKTVEHAYVNNGEFFVGLTVTDSDQSSVSTVPAIKIVVENVSATIKEILLPETIDEGREIKIIANASDPGINDQLNITWNFGDGSPDQTGINLTEVSHTYGKNGIYKLVLIIVDNEGALATATVEVNVSNLPPVITEFPSNLTGVEGEELAVFTTAKDSDDGELTYVWNFGYQDSSGKPVTETKSDVDNISHIYPDNGNYLLTLTVFDSQGASDKKVVNVVVTNADPEFATLPLGVTAQEGEEIQFTAKATDVAGDVNQLRYIWDFGDGSKQQTDISLSEVIHTYIGSGNFNVTCTVRDKDGGEVKETVQATIFNIDPEIIQPPTNQTADEGQEIEFNAVASDLSELTYIWDFGDGSEQDVGIDITSVTHIYVDDGRYQLILTVRDVDGASVTRTATINIRNAVPEFIKDQEDVEAFQKSEIEFSVEAKDSGEEDTLSYRWNFGDGTPEKFSGEESKSSHKYEDKGEFNASVTVTDKDGGESVHEFVVNVKNLPPEVDRPIGTTEGYEGDEFVFQATANKEELFYQWDFDDGETKNGRNLDSISHIYKADKVYNVTVTVTDADLEEAKSEVLQVTVNNAEPVANPGGPYTGKEGGEIKFDASQSTDPGGDPLIYQWEFNGETKEGEIVTFDLKTVGASTATLKVTDNAGESVDAEVNVTVENTPPTILAFIEGPYSGEVDGTIILEADADDFFEKEKLKYKWYAKDKNINFEKTGKQVEFVPEVSGEIIIVLEVEDANGGKAKDEIIVAVKEPKNAEPQVADDHQVTDEDQPVEIPVLVNDSDEDGDPLKVVSTTQPKHGIVKIQEDGTLLYTPNSDYFNDTTSPDSFTYKISDGKGGLSDSATVTVDVKPINDPPIVEDDVLETDEDQLLIIIVDDLTKNDRDAEKAELKLQSISSKSGRGIEIIDKGDGTYEYTPEENFFGTDSFTYLVADDKGITSGANVEIVINPVNDQPIPGVDIINDEIVILPEDTKGFEINVFRNQKDVDGDNLTVISVKSAENGKVEIGSEGLPVYTPNPDYFNDTTSPDSFTYMVSDGKGSPVSATVKILVEPVNDLPRIEIDSDTIITDEDVAVEIQLKVVDPDGDSLMVSQFTNPIKGEISGNIPDKLQAGDILKLTYTPPLNYFGVDAFSLKVIDIDPETGVARTDSAEAWKKVGIEILSVFDPPQFTQLGNMSLPADNLKFTHGTGKRIEVPISVKNPEGKVLKYTLTGLPTDAGYQLRSILGGLNFSWFPKSTFVGTHDIGIFVSGNPEPLKFQLEIFQINRMPAFQGLTSIHVDPNETPVAEFNIKVTDPDPNEVFDFNIIRIGSRGTVPEVKNVIALQEGKEGTSVDAILRWALNLEEDIDQRVKFIITVKDDDKINQLSAQAAFTIGVGKINTPPTLLLEKDVYNIRESVRHSTGEAENRLQDIDGSEDYLLKIQLRAEDGEDDPLVFEAEGLPTNAVFDQNTGEFFWEPTLKDGDGPDGARIWTVLLGVKEVRSDKNLPLSDQKTIRIRVQDRNIIPKMDPIADQQVQEGQLLTIRLQALDIDGDTISFRPEGLPLGAELKGISPGVAKISWIPDYDIAGGAPFAVTINALDPKATIKLGQNKHIFKINVLNTNQPPILVGELAAQSAQEGAVIQFSVTFTDLDFGVNPDEKITLTLENAPKNAELIDNGSGSGTFRWQTDLGSARAKGYQVLIVATDNSQAATKEAVQILVDNVNRPPEFVNPIRVPAQIIEGDTLTVPLVALSPEDPVLASDPDDSAEPLRFELKGQIPQGEAKIAGSTLLIKTKTGDAGKHDFTIRVFDRENAKGETDVQLNIAALNLKPVIDEIPPVINVVEGEELTPPLNIKYGDPNGDDILITISNESIGEFVGSEPGIGKFSWTAPLGQKGKEYKLTFTVQETNTNEKYETEVTTKLVVVSNTGPIIRELEVIGSRGVVTIQFQLKSERPVTASFQVAEGASFSSIGEKLNQETGNVFYEWDTAGYGTAITKYEIRVEVFDELKNKNGVTIGPVLIDNVLPEIHDIHAGRLIQSAANGLGDISVGTGEIVAMKATVTDNDKIDQVKVVLVGKESLASRSGDFFEAQVDVPENPLDLMRAAGITGIDASALEQGLDFPYYIEATDRAGNVARLPKDSEFTLRVVDRTPPQASIEPTEVTVRQGSEVELNASASTDNSGRVTGFAWDVDETDGVNFDESTYTGRSIRFMADRSGDVSLRIKDPAGNTSTATAKIIVVDRTPPEPPKFNSLEPAIVSANKVTISGETEPKAKVEIAVQGAIGLQVTAEADTKGKFSQEISDLPDGSYQIGGVAIDESGNTSRQANAIPLIIDNTPPQIDLVLGEVSNPPGSPNRMQTVHKTSNVRPPVPVRVTDAGGIAFIDLYLLEGTTSVALDGGDSRRNASGARSISDVIVPLEGRNLITGVTYTARVVARDLAGLRAENTLQFMVDARSPDVNPPQITFVSLLSEGMLTADQRLELKVKLVDNESGFNIESADFVSVVLSDVDAQPIALNRLSKSSNDINSVIITTYPVADLVSGRYTLSVQVIDIRGNTQNETRSFQVIGKPPIAVTVPNLNRLQEGGETDGFEYVSESPTTIDGTLDMIQLPGGGSVEVYVNGDIVARANIDETSGNFVTNVPLAEGKNEVTLVVVNSLGLKGSPSAPRFFVLDTLPPQIESLEPADGSTVGDVLEIRAIVKDSTIVSSNVIGINSKSVQLYINDKLQKITYDPFSGQLACAINKSFANGAKPKIRVKAADKFGNNVEIESTFEVEDDLPDTDPPVISGISPKSGSSLNTTDLSRPEFALMGSAYDIGSGLAEVQIRLDGSIVSSKVFQARLETLQGDEAEIPTDADIGMLSFTPKKLSDGVHVLTLYAKDKSGNEKITNSKFVVDTSAEVPTLNPILSPLNKRLVDLEGKAEPFTTIRIIVNEKPTTTLVAGEDGTFVQPKVILAEGQNWITMVATDIAGNVSNPSEMLLLIADVRPPIIGNPQPVPGSRIKSKVIKMSVELTDNPGGTGINESTLQLILDGNVELFEFTYDGEHLAYIPSENSNELTELVEGTHFFRVIASDAAGNTTTFDSGDFVVDYTPPEISVILPETGTVLSNNQPEVKAVVQAKDLSSVSISIVSADGTEVPVTQDFDAIIGQYRAKPDGPLANGSYTATVGAEDIAGNVSEGQVQFAVDTAAADETPPKIVPNFPQPGDEVSTTSMLAIDFQVLDADGGIDFKNMAVEINGVVSNDLFGEGSPHRYDRGTGCVVLYGRLQLELGALEDPLELGALEDPLELGALEDPLDAGALAEPMDLGALDDSMEFAALEDPLDLQALNEPLDLAVGLNTLSITVSDSFSNATSFDFNFGVSLTPPLSPAINLGGKPAEMADLRISNVRISERKIVAGQEFTVNFNASENITAVFLDFSSLDTTISSKKRPAWASGDDGGFGAGMSPGVLWDVVSQLAEIEPDITPPKLVKLDFSEIQKRLYNVPAKSKRYEATAKVSKNTKIKGGAKTASLVVLASQSSFDSKNIWIPFENPKTDGKSRGNRFSNRELVAEASVAQAQSRGLTSAFDIVINNRGKNKIYTNSPEIPMSGQIADYSGKKVEVEIFVNDKSMGIVPVDKDGNFEIDRILLKSGTNKVTSFTRSRAKLQSPASPAQTVFLDRTLPKIKFVNLQDQIDQPKIKAEIQFSDNSKVSAESITLMVNDKEPVVLPTDKNTITKTISLKEGKNLLSLSAVDAAGNISKPYKATVIVDNKPPDAPPVTLSGGLTYSGTEIVVGWTPDPDAKYYNLYRAEKPITELKNTKRRKSKLRRTEFTDSNVDVGITYYYALTSISAAGVESLSPSENLNVTILSARKGGTAIIAEGTRITARSKSISKDSTIYTAVSIENLMESDVPDFAGSIEGTIYRFTAVSQDGSAFKSKFAKNAQVTIPYPSFESPDGLSVYALDNGKWQLREVNKVDKKRKTFTVSTRHFETYRLVESAARENPWDTNRDEAVDILDLVQVSNAFGAESFDAYADIDRNGTVDILDLTLVAKHFGEMYGSAAAAPVMKSVEPRADVSMSIETIEATSSLKQVILSVNVALNERLKGFQFDLRYDPHLLDVIGIKEGNALKGSSFWIEPRLLDGKVEKVASVGIGGSNESAGTTGKMATVTFQLKGDVNRALESIHIENLKLSDSKASLIPVRIKSIDNLNQLIDPDLSFALGQNYPNPFNPETWIPYHVEENQSVTIRIYNAAGKLVRELDLGFKSAGSYISRHKAAYWNGRNLYGEEVASGIYFYEIEAGKFNATKKMIILK